MEIRKVHSRRERHIRVLCGTAALALIALTNGCGDAQSGERPATNTSRKGETIMNTTNATNEKIVKTDAEWKKQLSPEQYQVTRKKGTERAFTGKYWNNHESG